MGQALDDRPAPVAVGGDREAELEPLGRAVLAGAGHCHRGAVARSGVAVRRPTTVSMTALAAEAAEDSPRASMMAAPRFARWGGSRPAATPGR